MQEPKNHHLGTIAQLCRPISSQLRHILTVGKKLIKQQCLPHMSSQYRELWLTSGWDLLESLRHPCKFQRVSRLGSVTPRPRHSSSGRQPNFAALNRGRHLYSARRPSRWALAHISSSFLVITERCVCVFCRQQSEGFVIGDQCGVVLHGSSAVACNQTSDLRQLVIKFTRWSYSLPAPRRICNRRCLSVCLFVF